MLDITNYLVKERVGFMKLVDMFDIYNADSGEKIGIAIERPNGLVKLLRLIIKKGLCLPESILARVKTNLPM